MQAGQTREADHGIDDLLPVRNGVKLNHLALLEGCLFRLSRGAPNDSSGGGQLAIHVQFDFARQFDDCFGVMAVFEQRIFEGLRAADEQAAIEAVLFLGDPVAAPVLPDEDDRGRGTARWRFGELHVGIPSNGEVAYSDTKEFFFVVSVMRMLGWPVGRLLDSCSQYLRGLI